MYTFLDNQGTFRLEQPENVSYLYFPIAGEQGIKGAVTPTLGGDLKRSQNEFILQPVSAEELHNNKSTRNFWCYLGEKGCFSVTGVSARAQADRFTDRQDKSVLTAGPMWHLIERESKECGLSAKILSFVPVSDYCVELMHVEISNNGEHEVRFTPTAAVPVYGRSADNLRDHRHVTSLLHRAVTDEKGVYVTPTLSFDERGHQKNHITYYVCGMEADGTAPAGFQPVVEDYIGEGGSFEMPESVLKNLPYDACGKQYDGYEIIGALRFAETQLQPGEKRSYTIFIGAEEKKTVIDEMLQKYAGEISVLKAFEETKRYWLDKINVSYETADNMFDNFMYWVNFQPMLRRIYGCSFLPHHDYGKGGRGWRDLWQDCLALLIMNPDGVRQMLIDNYGGVRIDGSNATIIGSRQGEFIADRNNITRVWMDHRLWPLMTTKLYIDQTGDLSILLKENTYFKDRQEARGTRTDELWTADAAPVLRTEDGREYVGTILEHILVQNLTVFYEVGEHNHMRLRGADWNDALDMAPQRGESVAFTAAYADNLEVLAGLIGLLAEKEQIVRAADKYLYKKEVGGYRLNTDFGELKMDLGRMFGFAYGHKENGAVFSHMTTMYANALYRRGFIEEGYRAVHTLYEQAVDFDVSRIYPGIPEYFNDRGRGMYHYLTGAASWMMLTVITEMFGVKGRCGDLILEPKLRKEQFREGKAGIYLNFGKRRWHIVYVNAGEKESGEYQIAGVQLDGKKRETASVSLEEIRLLDENTVHEMIVELA